MNHLVKTKKLIEEIKSDRSSLDLPEFKNTTGDFISLCQFVTDWMIDRYDLSSPPRINCGYCFIWAYLVWALWPYPGVSFSTTDGHVIVKRDGVFYDSEHIDGDTDVNNFLSFGLMKSVDVGAQSMVWFWSRNGRYWYEFRKLVRRTAPKFYTLVRDKGASNWHNPVYFDPGKYIYNLS